MNDYISGSISGLVVCLIGHPLDTLKTVSQSRNKGIVTPHKWYRVYNGIKYPLVGSSIVHSCMFGTNKYLHKKTQNHYFSGFLTGVLISSIITPIELYKVRAQNMLSLKVNPYRGALPTVIRESISGSIYFGAYNQMRKNDINILVSGGLSGWLSWLSIYPIDVCKTRIQSDKARTIVDALKMGGLWKGFGYCSLRCVLGSAAGFYAYEKTIKFLTNTHTHL